MIAAAPSILEAIESEVAERVGSQRYKLWFRDHARFSLHPDRLDVGVPNLFFQEWLQAHFSPTVRAAALDVTGEALPVRFVVDGECFRVHRAAEARGEATRCGPPAATAEPLPSPVPARQPPRGEPSPRMPRPRGPRIEEFVVGTCNRLAYVAAQQVIESPGESFNPLLVHGGVGLGKTHLLQGICQAVRSTHRDWKVIYTTAEQFTNGFLEAMRRGDLSAFRRRYRDADLLALDDVHFLGSKRATQEEFLHTFNAVGAEGRQILLASDSHPKLIGRLSEELASRFMAGMISRIDPPDRETRAAILRARAARARVELPEEVIDYIAEHVPTNVRELEGAVHCVRATAAVLGRPIDLAAARKALAEIIRHTVHAVQLRDVERAVCTLFDLTPERLHAENRSRAVSYPRMVAMYLARKHTGLAYSEIGRFFGGRNHSTVIAADRKVAGWLREEQTIRLLDGFQTVQSVIETLERRLHA